MPTYDVRCRACGTTFEMVRPMAQADDPVSCPSGHDDTVRLLPTIAVTGRAGTRAPAATSRPASGPAPGGGCCGGGCCS